MRVYISGKITGTKDYMERFARAEKRLMVRGYSVVNPAKIMAQLPTDCKYEEYMKIAFPLMEICDKIYLLEGWEESKGAKLELVKAIHDDMKIETEGKIND